MSSILENSKPETSHEIWNSLKGKRCIMVCHDQDIDRRVLQEAETLIINNCSVLIICLSFNNFDLLEERNGIFIHRISLLKIAPDSKIYWLYKRYLHRIQNIRGRFSYLMKKCLNLGYKLLLKLIYRSRSIGYPLPFDYLFKYALDKYSADLIIAHDLPALRASVERGEELKVPVLYDAHEFYSEQKVFSGYQKRIMSRYEQKYITKCADILTVNSHFVDLFKQRYKVKSGHVVRNSYKFHQIQSITTLHSKIGKAATEKIILFQGGISLNRNLANLLKGFLLLEEPNVNLVFMGPSDKALLQKLQQIADSNLEKNVFLLAEVPQDQLINYTATATFGVIPYKACDLNTTYCTPNKLFEYIQAELPILYSNDLKEVEKIMSEIGGGGLGQDMSSPRKVKKALEMMLKRDLEKDRAIIRSAKSNICWEKDAEKFMEIINKIL